MTQEADSEPKGWKLNFFTIWTGQAFSLFGSSLVQFALVWWITESTGSATLLAFATLVGMLPQIVLGPVAGTYADRWNRKMVMMVADSSIALVSLVLAWLYLSGNVQVWHVFVVLLIRSLGGAFHWPAMQASTSLMVPHKHLPRVAGMNQALFGLMNIIAPPLGALLLGLLPVGGIMLIDVGTAAVAVISMGLMRVPQPARTVVEGAAPTSVWQDMKAGFRYLVSWKGLFLLALFSTLLNFFVTPAFSLLPIMVTKEFGGDAVLLGGLNSAYGIGLVVGGVLLSVWGGFKKRIHTSLLGLVGLSVGIMVIGFAPARLVGIAFAGMALTGLMLPIVNGPVFAIFQTLIAPDMQGRVLSLISSLSSLISPLSLMVAGPIADAVGVRSWFVVAGAACLIMTVIAVTIRPMMRIEEEGELLKHASTTVEAEGV